MLCINGIHCWMLMAKPCPAVAIHTAHQALTPRLTQSLWCCHDRPDWHIGRQCEVRPPRFAAKHDHLQQFVLHCNSHRHSQGVQVHPQCNKKFFSRHFCWNEGWISAPFQKWAEFGERVMTTKRSSDFWSRRKCTSQRKSRLRLWQQLYSFVVVVYSLQALLFLITVHAVISLFFPTWRLQSDITPVLSLV